MTRYCEGVKWGMRIMLIAIIMLAAYAAIPLVVQATGQLGQPSQAEQTDQLEQTNQQGQSEQAKQIEQKGQQIQTEQPGKIEQRGQQTQTEQVRQQTQIELKSLKGQPEQTEAEISDGLTTINESVSNKIYEVADGRVIAIKGSSGDLPAIVIENCTFNITGKTMSISGSGVGYNGETMTRIGIGGNVIFRNSIINVDGGSTNSGVGNDAAITIFDGNIDFENSTIDVENWKGQGLGLYGKADVEFLNSTLKNTANKNGWCYAMYGSSVLTLDNTNMSATGMTIEKDNTNAFYSGDSSTNYDALYIKNGSVVDFHDNQAGGFAINNVNIYVEDSSINVSDNAGNASNSGKWFLKGSELRIAGNRGGHGWSHHSDNVIDSDIEIIHNGFAGYYIRGDSNWKESSIRISCNGEKLKAYSGGDLWLNGNTLTVDNCGEVMLGAVGKAGKVLTSGNTGLIGYDIHESATKDKSSAVLTGANVIENDIEEDGHILFLNPWMNAKYARGIDDRSDDTDLFNDKNLQQASGSEALEESAEAGSFSADVIGKDNAKIGVMTDAQLAHHNYDWEDGEILHHASPETYGVEGFKCKACEEFVNHTNSHINSFDCPRTYVYAPLVGVLFDMNTDDDGDNILCELSYGEKAVAPEVADREGFEFKGWYADEGLNNEFDFDTELKDNYTIIYARWEEKTEDPDNPDNPDDPINPDNPDDPINPDNPDDPINPDNPDDPDNTNDGEEAISTDVAPETGDFTHIWILIAIMVGTVLVAIIVRKNYINNIDKLE